MVEAVLQTGKEMGAELVIMQEQRKIGTRDSTTSHPAYSFLKGGEESRVCTALAKTSQKRVTLRTDLAGCAEDYVQVLDITDGNLSPGGQVRIVNVYDQNPQEAGRARIAHLANWTEIMSVPRVIVAGDMNAHITLWNGRATTPRNHSFWEDLISSHGMTIYNSERATRSGANANCHSIVDLTLSKGNVELHWSIAHEDHSSGSNHEILVWEIVEDGMSSPTSKIVTGWDLQDFKKMDGSAEEKEKRKETRQVLKPDFRTPVWLDRQRGSSVSALLRRCSLALGLLSQLTGAGNTSLRNVYGMSPQCSPTILCCRLARSSAQDSNVFFVAFSIAVDLKVKVCLLLCCLLDRGRSQGQGMPLVIRSQRRSADV